MTPIEDLKLLETRIFEPEKLNSSTQGSLGALQRLNERYDLEYRDLWPLAYLLHFYPKKLHEEAVIQNIYRLLSSGYEQSIFSLEKKHFIYREPSPIYAGKDVIQIVPEAYESFVNDLPYDRGDKWHIIKRLQDYIPKKLQLREEIKGFEQLVLSYKCNTPFSKGWSELGLSNLSYDEKSALLILLMNFTKYFTKPCDIQPSNSGPDEDDYPISLDTGNVEKGNANYTAGVTSLLQKGLAIKPSSDSGYIISPKVVRALLHGCDQLVSYTAMSEQTTIIKASSITPKELFFSPESQEEIDNLRKILSPKGYERACSVLVRNKRNPSVQSLFWGGPGTGKTEVIKQLARESGRDIFLCDAAKLTQSDWGATEKMYRNLFLSYSYVVAVSSVTPILLMNEADQIIAKRHTDLSRSIEKAENIVVDIVLQEMEDMHGILLATTNLADVIDEAFDRRFLFKTHLDNPDADAQAKIWKNLLPELSEQDCAILAQKYDMTGAQISNVITRRDLAELYYEGDRGLSFIENLCSRELSDARRTSTKGAKIGFR